MRFDAYKATLPGGTDPQQAISWLALHNPAGELREGRPRHGYEACTTLIDGDGDRWLDVLHGGANGVMVETSGEGSPGVVDLVRSAWPIHAVARADVCQDFVDEEQGTYDRLLPRLEQIVRDHGRVKDREVAPRVAKHDGRSFYMGKRTSETYIRTYEKPEEMVSKGGHHSLKVFFGRWVRVEIETKPQKDNRLRACTFQPHEYFGLSRLGRAVVSQILETEVGKTGVIDYKKITARVRQRRVCLTQWGNMFSDWKGELGSWAEVGIAVKELMEELAREKNRQ